MPKKSTTPKLIVIFDTNVLFTQTASELLRQEVKKFIIENSKHIDLPTDWYLPEVVIGERRYQMLSKAKDLLPSMQKLEKLFGHGFGIAEDSLEMYVDKAISNSLKECNLKSVAVDTNSVDWDDIINRSVRRLPPFEAGEKEKGFRDAVIAQSFLKLVNQHPSTPNICRLAIITEDQNLRDYVIDLTAEKKNIRIISSLVELGSLINTLVSTVPEDVVKELEIKANKLFFEKEDEKTFYYKEKIREKINEQFSDVLKATYGENRKRSGGTWWISKPVFEKKEKQMLFWTSQIQADFEIYHYETVDQHQNSNASDLSSAKVIQSEATQNKSQIGELLYGLRGLSEKKKVMDHESKDKFEVHWKTNLTTAKNITNPSLIKIEYLGNDMFDDFV